MTSQGHQFSKRLNEKIMTVSINEASPFLFNLLELGSNVRKNQLEIINLLEFDIFTTELKRVFNENLSSSRRLLTTTGCKETATHYKWLIGANPRSHSRLWIHEFKEGTQDVEAYASIPHNHRYSFVSKILFGGYSERFWSHSSDRSVFPSSSVIRKSTEAHFIDSSWIHSLEHIKTGTLTAVVEGAPEHSASTSWNLDGSFRAKHTILEDRADFLLQRLDRIT